MILGVEFDILSGYENSGNCTKWLQSSPFAYLQHFKTFHLRKKKFGLFMSEEKRPVFAWYGDLYRYKNLKISRPEQGVVVIEMAPDVGVFLASEYPPMQPVTEQKLAEKLVREKQRKEKREKKRKEQREKKVKTEPQLPKPKLNKRKSPSIKVEPSDSSSDVEFTRFPVSVSKAKEILNAYSDGSQDPNPNPFSPLGVPILWEWNSNTSLYFIK